MILFASTAEELKSTLDLVFVIDACLLDYYLSSWIMCPFL